MQVHRVGRDSYVRVIAGDMTLCRCHEVACKGWGKRTERVSVVTQKTR
jgi:hypothetical protein